MKPKTQQNKGLIVAIVVLSLLAAGGIGFGVYNVVKNNKNEAPASSDKKTADTSSRSSSSSSTTPVNTPSSNSGSSSNSSSSSSSSSSSTTEDTYYIDLSGWGIKIATGKSLITNVKVNNADSISIHAIYSSEKAAIERIGSYPYGITIVRSKTGPAADDDRVLKDVEFNGYHHLIYGQTGVGMFDLSDAEYKSLEKANNELKERLTNLNNYKAI